ncbi:indolepyruvate oxidoreductase subunit B [Thauera sp. 63]|nr:indolepyruvate oxidoreductase subunit B [Thauera sp. 63]
MAAGKSLRVLIGTVGGQGGGVLSDWLVHGLINAGWDAVSIGLLGISQRGGTVTYYCEAAPDRSRRRTHSMFAMPGDVNLLIGQELLELGRLMGGGYASSDCVIVGNTARTYATLEKMPAEEGIFDSKQIFTAAHDLAPDRHYLCNAQAVVVEQGLSALSSNAFLLGAAVAAAVEGVDDAPFVEAIKASEINVKANIAAFQLGYRLVKEGRFPAQSGPEAARPDASRRAARLSAAEAATVERLLAQRRDSAELAQFVRPAVENLIDYMDEAHAAHYLELLDRLAGLPGVDIATLKAFARHGALWLAYEDIPRVAQLKTRPERYLQVLREHGIKPRHGVEVTDFLVPDAEQIVGMLPPWMGRIVAGVGGMLMRDFDKRSFPLRLGSTTVSGYWSLRTLAAFRGMRRRSSRYAHEMDLFKRWYDAIGAAHARSPVLGCLVAEAGRVVKGYGRVRDQALDDLWGFLDEGVLILERIQRGGGDVGAVGRAALKILASESGTRVRCLAALQKAEAEMGDVPPMLHAA